MRVDHVAFSKSGGAGIAARRIVEAQKLVSIDAALTYRTEGRLGSPNARSPWIVGASVLDNFLLRKHATSSMISILRGFVGSNLQLRNKSLLHLHWLPGVISLSNLQKILLPQKVLAVTLHDMWLFSGGCHFSDGCKNFKTGCYSCPIVRAPFRRVVTDQSDAKRMIYARLEKLVVVAPSQEMIEMAAQSSVFPSLTQFVHIPNPVEKLGLTAQNPISNTKRSSAFTIAVIANDLSEPRKNVMEALRAFHKLRGQYSGARTLEMVLIGRKCPKMPESSAVKSVGHIDNPVSLSEELSSVDLLWSFSSGEVFPNTITEAAARGIPSVLSQMTGHTFASDAGFAYLFEDEDQAIELTVRLINEPQQLRSLAKNARKFADSLSPEVIGLRYREVYEALIN